jgi:ABC-2 type transport system permease protein
LQEPLLIRAYISEKNHPLLEPLVPYIRDMLDEYEIASNGNLDVEIIDPIKDPKKEAEANQVYGIQSTPLQVSDRYGASVINVYFDILIRYGDQNVVLNFRDLIDVDEYGNGDIDVRLRNLEYDLTRSIRKVVYGFQSIDAVLAALDQPAQLVLYYTPDTLPQDLQSAPDTIQTVAQHISNSSGGKFTYESVNISDPANNIDPQQLYNQYGIQPFAESFLSSDTYYLHMLLTAGGKTQVIYPEGDLSEASVRSSIEGALQRAAPGFMKVVGIWTPTQPQYDVYGQQQQQIQSYDTLTQSLQQNYETQTIDLSTGEVPTNVDILLLVAPENMTDIERYAVDQYLMRGGTVCVFTGNSKLGVDQMNGTLILQPLENGLQDMLSFYGVSIDPSIVLDEQNSVFPIQVARNVGGMQVQEIQAMQYPFFVDVRTNEMNRSNPILAHLNSITMNWASPVIVDQDKNADRQVTTLFHSSPHSWTSTNTDIEPNLNVYPELGFAEGDTMQSYPLAVVVQGSFDSYFKDKPSPFTTSDQTETVAPITGPIDTSPDNARLIVIGSSEFLNDTVFQLVSSMDRQGYVNNLQLVQNVVDWSTEDTDLLALRSRGMSARLLDPMTESKQKRWEVVNYALALASLAVIGGLWQWRKRAEKPMTLVMAPTTAAEVLSYEQNQ